MVDSSAQTPDAQNSASNPAANSIEAKVQAKIASAAPTEGAPAETKIIQAGEEPHRPEVSAQTIGRMLGLATVTELKLVEGKLDLLSAKITTITTRVEKVLSMLGAVPTGSDLDRIDVQIGGLKSQIRDFMTSVEALADGVDGNSEGARKKPGSKIVSNVAQGEAEKN